MQFSLDRDVLLSAVSYTAKVLPSRPPNPINNGMLLVTDGNHLTASVFDPNDTVTATATVDANVEAQGRILLPGKLLAEFVKQLPAGTVTLSPEGNRVRLQGGKAKFFLPLLPVEDLPQFPAQPTRSGVLSTDAFAAAVAQVEMASADSDGTPVLTGIRIEVDGPKITLVATDRYRLAVRELTWRPDDPTVKAQLVLPAKALIEGAKGLHGDGAELTLHIGERMLGLTGTARTIAMNSLDGEYPRWQILIGNKGSATATVNSAEFVEALNRVSSAKGKADPVRITFGKEAFTIAAGSGETAAEDEVAGQFDGEPMTVGFNPEYLRDGVKAASSDEVEIKLSDPKKPAFVTGKGGTDGYLYLAMPVRLNQG